MIESIAMLITDRYRKQQTKLHRNERYGRASGKWAHLVVEWIERKTPASILDYGAGKGYLKHCILDHLIGKEYAEYDPAMSGINAMPPGEFDMVCCIDVLEHIEPDCLNEVLDSLQSKVGKFAFVTIHTGPAGKELPDGRNAHLIQQPISWWRDYLDARFDIPAFGVLNATFWAICEVKR